MLSTIIIHFGDLSSNFESSRNFLSNLGSDRIGIIISIRYIEYNGVELQCGVEARILFTSQVNDTRVSSIGFGSNEKGIRTGV